MGDAHYHESSLEVASDQTIHIFAQEDSWGSNVYYQNHTLSDVVIPGGTSQFFATAIDQNDILHFVGSHSDTIWYTYYDNNGWSTAIPIDLLAASSYHPSIACDNNGILHVTFASSAGIYYLNNETGSWGTPENTGGIGIFPNIAVDENGYVHIAYYTQVENGIIYYINNLGGSWTTPEYIATINTDTSPETEDAAHVEGKIALDLKTSTVNIVYIQSDSLVSVAHTHDYELRQAISTAISSTLSSDLLTPATDTLNVDIQGSRDYLQFTISDLAGDGVSTKIQEMVIQRGPEMSEALCFNDIFQSVSIAVSDGSSSTGNLFASKIIVGTSGEVWKSIPEGGSLSFTVTGLFNNPLENAANQCVQLKVNGLHDVIIDTSGSHFAYSCQDVVSNPILFTLMDFSGAGTAANPYLIETLEDLRTLSENDIYWDKYFSQTADIDASLTSTWNNGAGFSPIGNNTQFTGFYDGHGYIIDGLTINRSGTANVGFFGSVNGTSIQNLGLTNVSISAGDEVGGLVGFLANSEVSHCFTSGSISGGMFIGGLIGFAQFGTISQCYSYTNVSGNSLRVGGLTGYNYSSTISNCYNIGDITRLSGASLDIAGFCGYNYGSTIEHSYSVANVIYNGDNPTDKGFIGMEVGTSQYTENFFDHETSNQSTAIGATGKTSTEMKTQATFSNAGWDFSTPVWVIDSGHNGGYPFFGWQEFDTTNTAPVANDIALTANEDETLAITLSGTDAEGDSLSYSIATPPADGLLSGDPPNLTYTANANWSGIDTFTYVASDGSLNSLPAVVTITISPVNDPPCFTSIPDTTATENIVYTDSITFTDIDSDNLVLTGTVLPDWLSLNTETHILSGTPMNAAVGANAVVLAVSDGIVTTTQSFMIQVLDVNNAPDNFELMLPLSDATIVLTSQNLADTLWFGWTASVDNDNDSLIYEFHPESELVFLSDHFQFKNTTTAFVDYATLAEAIDTAGMAIGHWTIAVTDGIDTVAASNGPFSLTIDATAVGIHALSIVPDTYFLEQNYPNPFNPTTTIRYSLPEASDVSLVVYDVTGHEVANLVHSNQSAGWYDIQWGGLSTTGSPVSTGLYFARIQAGQFSRVIKMAFIK